MIDLPYESLLGIAYGLLFGFGPALLAGFTAIAVGIGTDRSLPLAAGLATVPIAVGTGVVVRLFDPSAGLEHGPRVAMAATIAGALGIVVVAQGDRIATELPRDRAVPIVRGTALSADAIDAVDAVGQVTIRSAGAIREFDGYPELSPALRTALEEGAWRFPADLQLSELERRLEQRLRATHELSKIDVAIDGRGRATIAAAPPTKSVATSLSDGARAVTVSGLLPTGIESGDRVAIGVVSGGSDGDGSAVTATLEGDVLAVCRSESAEDGASNARSSSRSTASRAADAGFEGGPGRLTVRVAASDAGRLLGADRYRIAVLPSGDAPAFEAAALLEDAGRPITTLEGREVLEGEDRAVDAGEVLGVHSGDEWEFVDEYGDENRDVTVDTADDNGASDADTDKMTAATPTRAFVATSREREVTDG
ncbi:hypothetical protein [Halopiger xanaduensis]|uniref:RCK C-terminal domain-containing protein n=1 Tax=Halopiger xanaduensis (strain DSM 18323 / JCM 14033 / SH-6) TaxID=797210 RepID=F8D3N9_HALXS|nr:hypothetical protein [Halopiger xanaduensis]AEH37406.1 hypothetical protein Halxa_2790 [Halopiger xanaduensis SH-6]